MPLVWRYRVEWVVHATYWLRDRELLLTVHVSEKIATHCHYHWIHVDGELFHPVGSKCAAGSINQRFHVVLVVQMSSNLFHQDIPLHGIADSL